MLLKQENKLVNLWSQGTIKMRITFNPHNRYGGKGSPATRACTTTASMKPASKVTEIALLHRKGNYKMGRIDTRLKHFLVRRIPYSQMAESGEHIRDAVGTRDDISLSARDRDKNRLFLERAIQAFVFLILISSTILHQEGPYGDSAVGVAERARVLSSK